MQLCHTKFGKENLIGYNISNKNTTSLDTDREYLRQIELTDELNRQKIKVGNKGMYASVVLNNCGNDFRFYQCQNIKKCGKMVKMPIKCDLFTLCPKCAKERASKLYKKYEGIAKSMKNPRFVSLTFVNTKDISKDYFKKCSLHWAAFKKKLQREGYIVNIGLIVKQTVHRGNSYHHHFHVLFDGSYIPRAQIKKGMRKEEIFEFLERKENKKTLQAMWYSVTGDSYIADIRYVRHSRQGLSYVMSYVSKGNEFKEVRHQVEFFSLTKNMRMVQTFGIKYRAISKPKYKMVCPFCLCDEVKFIGVNIEDALTASINPRFKKDKTFCQDTECKVGWYTRGTSYSSILLDKIREDLSKPHNEIDVEDKLTKSELSYLLKNGDLFLAKRDEYRVLE